MAARLLRKLATPVQPGFKQPRQWWGCFALEPPLTSRPRRYRPSFPYAERAAAAENAHRDIHAFARLTTRREDPDDPATRRWLDAADRFRAAMRLVLPPGFAEQFADLRQGDLASIEPMIEFLEADPYFYGSGYLKTDIIKLIRHMPLNSEQTGRLRGVVLAVLDRRDCREFRNFCQLARAVYSPELLAEVERRTSSADPALRRRAGWMRYAMMQ